MSERQQVYLRELGIPILIPTYVPDGFQVSQVVSNSCRDAPRTGLCREGPYYSIVYQNAQSHCLIVNAVSGGVGGGASEFAFSTDTPLLGKVEILFGKLSGPGDPPTAGQLTTLQANLGSFPARLVVSPGSGRSPYYNVVAADRDYDQTTYGCSSNNSITPAELEKILQSLVVLN